MEHDDELPFEELDPCCQREILERRRFNEVSSQLRTVDRSEHRHDVRSGVLKSRSDLERQRFHYCQCCAANVDYTALNGLRKQIQYENMQRQSQQDEEQHAGRRRVSITEEEEEDSDEEFLRELEEQDRLRKMHELQNHQSQQRLIQQRQQQILQKAEIFFGLGQHREETLDHLCSLTETERQNEQGAPLLLHLYSEDSQFSATLDLALEQLVHDLCPGLRARRLPLRVLVEEVEQQKPYMRQTALGRVVSSHGDIQRLIRDTADDFDGDGQLTSKGAVLCFEFQSGHVGHVLTATCRDRDTCVPGSVTDTLPLLQRLLDRAGINDAAVSVPMVARFDGSNRADGDSDEDIEEADEGFDCGVPGCTRRYPHEHVSKTGGGGPSFVGEQTGKQGAEALEKNVFTRF
jgi:hypothetical protein